MSPAPALPFIEHLPRLRSVLSDVLGIRPDAPEVDLDMAEALACDDRDRAEVMTTLQGRFGIAVSRIEASACESVADLLRLACAKFGLPTGAFA